MTQTVERHVSDMPIINGFNETNFEVVQADLIHQTAVDCFGKIAVGEVVDGRANHFLFKPSQDLFSEHTSSPPTWVVPHLIQAPLPTSTALTPSMNMLTERTFE